MIKLLCLIILNHRFSDWEIFTWSYELRSGGEERTCRLCDERERRPISLRSCYDKSGLIELPTPNNDKRIDEIK